MSRSTYSVTSCLVAEEFRTAGVLGRADARDLGRRAIQRVGHFTGHHVDLIAARKSNDDVRLRGARRFQHGRIGAVARDGAYVEAVLQIAQDVLIGIDDGDLVRLLAGEMIGRGAAHLACAQNHDLQRIVSRFAY
jgi:hypothetical protein